MTRKHRRCAEPEIRASQYGGPSRETRTESELRLDAREETVNPVTQADYDLLLSLMEPGFEAWSVERFNDMVQTALSEEDAPIYRAYKRVLGDVLGRQNKYDRYLPYGITVSADQ